MQADPDVVVRFPGVDFQPRFGAGDFAVAPLVRSRALVERGVSFSMKTAYQSKGSGLID